MKGTWCTNYLQSSYHSNNCTPTNGKVRNVIILLPILQSMKFHLHLLEHHRWVVGVSISQYLNSITLLLKIRIGNVFMAGLNGTQFFYVNFRSERYDQHHTLRLWLVVSTESNNWSAVPKFQFMVTETWYLAPFQFLHCKPFGFQYKIIKGAKYQ